MSLINLSIHWVVTQTVMAICLLLMGFALTSTTLFAGGSLEPAFSMPQLMIIILLGNLILGCTVLLWVTLPPGAAYPQSRLPAFNWAGVIAYVVGSVVAYVTGNAGVGIGPVNGMPRRL